LLSPTDQEKKNYIAIVTHTLPQEHVVPNNGMHCISNLGGNYTLHKLSVSLQHTFSHTV